MRSRRPRTQESVIKELEPMAIRSVDKVRRMGSDLIARLWKDAKDQLRQSILHEYYRDFPNTNEKWSLGMARAKGTFLRIEKDIAMVLNQFHADSLDIAKRSFNSVYATASLRHAWILDQVTPPSYNVRVPMKHKMGEAAVPVYSGSEGASLWRDRWGAWMGSYQSALNNNLRMSAINESDPNDAAKEVDQTKAGTPAYDLRDALDRIYNYQALAAYSDAVQDLTKANWNMGIVEIWQTRDNQRVCDDCDENAGLTAEQATSDIPAHPNCECYWRQVPDSWAELLKSGDADDNELARLLDAQGVVPNSMVIKDDDGNLMAHAIVSFEKWSEGLPQAVGTSR